MPDQETLAKTGLAELSKRLHTYRPALTQASRRANPAEARRLTAEISRAEQRIDEIVDRLFLARH